MDVRTSLRQIQRKLRGAPAGHFDGFSGAVFSGWAQTGDGPPAQVNLYFGDRFIASTLANAPRPDLEALFPTRFNCGFVFRLVEIETALAAFSDDSAQSFHASTPNGRLPGSTGPVRPSAFADQASVLIALHLHGTAITMVGA